jgi:hypothetical protein
MTLEALEGLLAGVAFSSAKELFSATLTRADQANRCTRQYVSLRNS